MKIPKKHSCCIPDTCQKHCGHPEMTDSGVCPDCAYSVDGTIFCESCAAPRSSKGARMSGEDLGRHTICAKCAEPSRRMFKKYEKSGGKWHYSCTFTIPEFMRDNAHDIEIVEEFVPKLEALAVGKSFIYYGGAGGDDKFKRVK